MFNIRPLVVLATLAIAVFPYSTAYGQWLGSYDPSLGTLPTSQGWSLTNTGSNPTPSVNGGVLNQGLTSVNGIQFWERPGISSDFTTAQGLVFELDLKVTSSSYVEIPALDTWQPGFIVALNDINNNEATLGISDTGVRVGWNNFLSGFSSAFIPWDTTSTFSTYLLTVNSSVLSLSINGTPVVTGLAIGGPPATLSNTFAFGDGSEYASSQTELRAVRWGVIPEPNTIYLIALGCTLVLFRRNRIVRWQPA